MEQKAFEDVITWYENDILNPSSLSDPLSATLFENTKNSEKK